MKKLLAGLMLLGSSYAAADIQVAVGSSVYDSERVASGMSYSVSYGEDFYAFASYDRTKTSRVTQSLGRLELFGAGFGARGDLGSFRPFVQAGYYIPEQTTRFRTKSEIIYYSFQPTFGTPPFEPPNSFNGLNYTYELEGSAGLTVGFQHELTSNVLVEAGYRWLAFEEYFNMYTEITNPDDLDACACLWEGKNTWNMNGASVKLVYRWWH